MSEIDWNPLLCQVAALRIEMRALSMAVALSGANNQKDFEVANKAMLAEQATADRVANGGKR